MARSQSEMKKHVGMVGLVCRSPAAAPKTTPRARIAPAAPPLASAGIALNLCANWREMDAPSRARRGGPGRDIWAVAGGSSSVPRAASSAPWRSMAVGFWCRKPPDLCNQNQYRPTGAAIFIFRCERGHSSSFGAGTVAERADSRQNRLSMAAIILSTD